MNIKAYKYNKNKLGLQPPTFAEIMEFIYLYHDLENDISTYDLNIDIFKFYTYRDNTDSFVAVEYTVIIDGIYNKNTVVLCSCDNIMYYTEDMNIFINTKGVIESKDNKMKMKYYYYNQFLNYSRPESTLCTEDIVRMNCIWYNDFCKNAYMNHGIVYKETSSPNCIMISKKPNKNNIWTFSMDVKMYREKQSDHNQYFYENYSPINMITMYKSMNIAYRTSVLKESDMYKELYSLNKEGCIVYLWNDKYYDKKSPNFEMLDSIVKQSIIDFESIIESKYCHRYTIESRNKYLMLSNWRDEIYF